MAIANGKNSKPNNDALGRDLLLCPSYAANNFDGLDLVSDPREPLTQAERVDFALASGGDCLRQALVLRLLTPQGSLTDLGHAAYGSRLHELVGEPNTATNRNRARSFVLQAVADEPRVAKVLGLTVPPPLPGESDRIRIELHVEPATGGDPVTLGLEVGG